MNDLMNMDIIIDVGRHLDEMTVERAEALSRRKLAPKRESENVVGEVTSAISKRLFACMIYAEAHAGELIHSAQMEVDQARADEIIQESERLSEFADLFKALFFIQIQYEMQVWDKCVGVREGWQIVERVRDDGPEIVMRRLFGGGGA